MHLAAFARNKFVRVGIYGSSIQTVRYRAQIINVTFVRLVICTLLGYYAARNGNSFPKFRDHLGTETSGKELPQLAAL